MISQTKRICLIAALLTMASATGNLPSYNLDGSRWVRTPIGALRSGQKDIEKRSRSQCRSISSGPMLELNIAVNASPVRVEMEASMLDTINEKAFVTEIKPRENMKFDFSYLPSNFFTLTTVFRCPAEDKHETFEEKTARLQLAYAEAMQGEDVPPPLHHDSMKEHKKNKTVFKIVGLKNAAKYNGYMGRVMGFNSNDKTRWNMEIAFNGERMILAIKPEVMIIAGDDETEEATAVLNGPLKGDTVRFSLQGEVGVEWHMGRVVGEESKTEKSLSFSDTESVSTTISWTEEPQLLIAPYSGMATNPIPISKLVVVTPEEIASMDAFRRKTEKPEGEINAYLASLRNGCVYNVIEKSISNMEKILEHFTKEEHKNIQWREDELRPKLENALKQMQEMLPENQHEAYSRFSQIALLQLVNGMTYERAADQVYQECGY